MIKVNNKLLHSTAVAALAVSMFAMPAHAQDAAGGQDDDSTDQSVQDDAAANTIIVSGIRASIGASVDDKRRSGQIIDTINAEDIGRSTDQNIAEALNRVSGVSINTVDGEGSTISVRGANADQTVVTLNGATLGSTGFSQGVDLSAYSADILASVEVVKTPSADDVEGSLAAVVNLITRRPLEVGDDIRTATIQGRYNDLSENFDHKFSATFSQRFFDNRFGIIATVYDESNSVRRDQIYFNNYDAFGSNLYTDQNGNAFGAQAALDADLVAAAANNRPTVFEGVQGVGSSGNPHELIGWGIAPSESGYQLQQNDRERRGIDFSAQWEISNRTDLTLNATYSQQQFSNRLDGVFVNSTRFFGHIDGVQQPNLFLPGNFLDRTTVYDTNSVEFGGAAPDWNQPVVDPTINDQLQWTDPVHLWRTLNTDTRTWDQFQSRHSIGGTQASVNDFENENFLIGGELRHEFSNAFRVSLGGNYARSEQTPDRNIFLVANRGRTIGPWNLHHVPADLLVPAGYDCSGDQCNLIGGDTDPYLGNIVDFQSNTNDLWDNVGRTGFNPDDLPSHTLAFIASSVIAVEDEQNTAFIDFDWDVDFAGVTSFEFGGRYEGRSKFVDAQTGTPRASQDLVEAISPFTGETIFVDPNAINLISAALFSSGQTDAPGFLEGLGVARDNITDGFETFDPVAALDAITDDIRDFTLDRTQTRGAEFDNFAVYAKANFEYLDNRLRGDIGLRWVRTEVSTTGFAGAQFAFDSQGRGRVLDPIYLNTLRNSDQANQCPVLSDTPSPLGVGPASDFWTGTGTNPADVNAPDNYDLTAFQERNRQARIDGLGNAPAVPGNVCYDPLLEPGAIPGTFNERNLVRYADLSTEQFGSIGGNALPDRSRASIAASDSYSYDVFLPNLNLSFIATDDIILRASAYRTMSRPPIDDLRAGFRLNEGTITEGNPVFRTSSTVDLFSAQINPLVADNIDLAAEWYFDNDALLSVNFFYKDISDLIETVDERWFIGDLRRIASDPDGATVDGLSFTSADGTTTDLLLTNSSDVNAQPDIANCFPRRIQGEATIGTAANSWLYSEDARLLCNEYNITTRQNSESAKVRGLELQYVHNYTFLPGLLGGLGVAANYTFQDGEFQSSGFPIPGTPRHSYNVTGFWQDGPNQLRLAYSGQSDSLIQRSFGGGSLWQEGRETLDFSAAWGVTDNFTLLFEGSNLLDSPVRSYFTSRIIRLPDANGDFVNFDEGSIRDGAPTNRTVQEYNTGRIFRISLRAEF